MNMGAQDCRINLGYIYIHINQSPKRRSNIYYGGLNTGCWWVDEVCFIVLWSMSKHGTLQLLFFMYESYRRFWDCQFACFHFYFDLRLAIPKHCEKSKNNALKHAICSNDSNVSIRQHSNKLSHTHTHLHIPESKATTVITHKEWERSPLVPINRKPWKPLWFVTFGTSPQLISPSPAIPLLSFQSHNRAEVRRRCHLVDIHGT